VFVTKLFRLLYTACALFTECFWRENNNKGIVAF